MLLNLQITEANLGHIVKVVLEWGQPKTDIMMLGALQNSPLTQPLENFA